MGFTIQASFDILFPGRIEIASAKNGSMLIFYTISEWKDIKMYLEGGELATLYDTSLPESLVTQPFFTLDRSLYLDFSFESIVPST